MDHNFIYASLKKFGFGKDFVQWIKTLFKNFQSCVINNGSSTGYFGVERGTRQDDPLFPYLFILILEILFIKVRNDSSIKGFWIKQIEIKLSAYADDTTFFVKDVQSLQRILNLMKKFREFSSLTISVKNVKQARLVELKLRS